MSQQNELREALAAQCHEQWAHWMKYLFSKIEPHDHYGGTIDWEDMERWKRQMNTPYSELSEEEKDSDRQQADKILEIPEIEHIRDLAWRYTDLQR